MSTATKTMMKSHRWLTITMRICRLVQDRAWPVSCSRRVVGSSRLRAPKGWTRSIELSERQGRIRRRCYSRTTHLLPVSSVKVLTISTFRNIVPSVRISLQDKIVIWLMSFWTMIMTTPCKRIHSNPITLTCSLSHLILSSQLHSKFLLLSSRNVKSLTMQPRPSISSR